MLSLYLGRGGRGREGGGPGQGGSCEGRWAGMLILCVGFESFDVFDMFGDLMAGSGVNGNDI